MRWHKSSLFRVYSLIRQRGLKNGINRALDLWSKRRMSVPKDVISDYMYVLSENRPEMLSTSTNGSLRINWILPEIGRGSGGLFNIFRTIAEFEKWGHLNKIYLVSESNKDIERFTSLVQQEYFKIASPITFFTETVADSDATIATSWETAYRVRTISNTARKFYFVQDMENLFSAEGSLSEFARQTYQWGFYGLTAGKWIAGILENEFSMECSSFGFSYDRVNYSLCSESRPLSEKKRVLFYARPGTPRRGFELGILALSLVIKRLPDVQIVLVGFPLGSVKLPFQAEVLGTLEVAQLGALYRSCEVALVLSFTNASLLPLELMACGCAVVSNDGPNVEWILDSKIASLSKPTPQDLSKAIIEFLIDEELRGRIVSSAKEFVSTTNWINEIRAIEDGLYKGLGIQGRL